MKIKEAVNLVSDTSLESVLKYFTDNSSVSGKKRFIVSINPEIIMIARRDREYENVLKSADLALNDGVGVSFAAGIFGKKHAGRIPGADLVEEVCAAIAKKPITVGFLGGKGNVAIKTSERLSEQYPGLKVAFALEEWPEDKAKSLKTDILFVAFGSPKQEKWIFEHLQELNVKIVMGVGGTFDFISGNVRRAPAWVRKVGLEWFFRLIVQPWRIKRQLKLVPFVLLVLLEKIGL